MKRTKTIINLLAMLCFLITVAQEDYTQSLSGIKKVQIETGTTVRIVAGTSNELRFTKYERDSTNSRYDNEYYEHIEHTEEYEDSDCDECPKKTTKKDRSKGLKAVYAGGTDNTGFGMSIEKDGDVLRIKDLKSWMQRGGLQIVLPKDIDIKLDCGNLGSAQINGFSSEIEVKTNVGGIVLSDVTGPITAHTSTGLVEVKFSSVNQASPISLSSSTGVVDVTLPSNTKANLELRSSMGSVYTDFDLQPEREDGMKIVGSNRKIVSKLNGGGVNIELRSSTGNVYLRKQ